MREGKILITGAGGQIGTVLSTTLETIYGKENIIKTDIKPDNDKNVIHADVLIKENIETLVKENNIKTVFHLAAILSAKGEQNPRKAWDINMIGLFNILDVCKENYINKLFFPSTIAVFGPEIPLVETPNHVPLIPSTVYGISKVSGELWCNYYSKKYNMDIRSLRYPGVVGYQSLAGGGTTDYAVDIFHANAKGETFNCFLDANTILPMIYIDDCIDATIKLMEADKKNLTIQTSYNLAGFSFSPIEIYNEILKHNKDFKIIYSPDFRQQIASSWPQSIDDSMARRDWNWSPRYNLSSMVEIMIKEIRNIYK